MMKALVFRGPYDVRLEEKPIPEIVEQTDVIIKTTSAALCGSELHRYRGHSKSNMQPGYVCGHEGIGIVHEIGSEVKKFAKGDRVSVPFLVSWYRPQSHTVISIEKHILTEHTSGECFHCQRGVHGRCKKGRNFGGPLLDGSQAQYFKVPLADSTLYNLPQEADLGELAILMTDIFPTGFNGARRAFSDTPKDQWKDMSIAVVGCGPVALCSIISAREYGPARIFAIDSNPSRLEAARELGCIPLNFKKVDVVAEIKKATDNNGVHAVIEGVGLTPALKTAYDIVCPGGKISSFGVHNGDLPFTAADCYNKDVHIHFGRCPIRVVFADALATLIRNKELINKMRFIDLVLPGLDDSFEDALKRFEKGELTKVVFKPNGPDP